MAISSQDDEVLVLVPASFAGASEADLRGALGCDFRIVSRTELARVEVRSCVAMIAGAYDLTQRHGDVLGLILGGESNEEIAVDLRIAIGTVKSHIEEMLKRTGTRNRQKLAALAFGVPGRPR